MHQLSDSVNHETKLTANRAIKTTTTTKIHTTYSALGRPLGKLFNTKDGIIVATYGWLAVQSFAYIKLYTNKLAVISSVAPRMDKN